MYIFIKRQSEITLTKQIYQAIKTKILTGELKAKEKLPSTRQLSRDLKLSRNVVMEAYEQLLAEGYMVAIESSGTYVSDGIVLEHYKPSAQISRENIIGLRHEPQNDVIDFRTGVPNLELFPKELWADLYKKNCQDLPALQLDYHEPRGCYDLRYELAIYLKRVRGIGCEPKQVLITTGAAQAFTMLGRLFNPINKEVLVEDPLSHGIIASLEKTQMSLHPVPVDDRGIRTELLPQTLQPSLIFTTPSHQYPTGCVLPIKRRIELLQYAREKGAYIVEDDYDSEFRFEGAPIESIQNLDPSSVIYVGTFSKILCPALRMGYMIIPEQLIEQVIKIKYAEDLHSPVLEQLTLARFIREGYLDKHIRKSRNLYHQKSLLVSSTLLKLFGDRVIISGQSTGIHLVVTFKDLVFNDTMIKMLEEKGVKVPTVEAHTLVKGFHCQQIMIGYSNLTDGEIIEGIARMSEVINRERQSEI